MTDLQKVLMEVINNNGSRISYGVFGKVENGIIICKGYNRYDSDRNYLCLFSGMCDIEGISAEQVSTYKSFERLCFYKKHGKERFEGKYWNVKICL